jgi:rubrerythrin
MKRLALLATVAALAVLAAPLALAAGTAQVSVGTTLDNLQAAYNGESNASAKYLEFAKQADKEGYAGVASLFRAASRAEAVHAAKHATVIKSLGGTPTAKIEPAPVKSTKENLEAAIAGESYERDAMYPQFIGKARTDRNKDAIESFNYAKTAEAEHATLYADALKNIDAWKAKKTFYVCTICGYTVIELPKEKCVSCFSPKDKYEAVS